jgi:hypothetical protein
MLRLLLVQHPSPHDKVGLRSFMNLKPDNVRRMREKDRITCGCSKHENLRLAITGFNLASLRVHENNPCPEGAECRIRGRVPSSCHELLDKFLCARPVGQEHPSPQCVDGTCLSCGGGLALPLCAKERQTVDAIEVCANMHMCVVIR